MAAYTATVTGNWDQTATWGGSGPPVSGDTATINSGVTVTVPVGYTAVVGTSPTSDAGTVALTINGPLTINGTLKYRGPVRQGNATVTVAAGGTITYDASGAATPATALYAWQISQANQQANAKIILNGTSGSHCTVNSVGNVASGGFGNTSTNYDGGGRVEATYTDFSYAGGSGNVFLACRLWPTYTVSFDHCTLDHCGQINVGYISASSTFAVRNTRVTSPANTTYTFQINCNGEARTTGTRELLNDDIAGQVYFLSGTLNNGFVHKHCIHRVRDVTSTSSNSPVTYNSGNSSTSWDQNLIFLAGDNTTADHGVQVPNATLTSSYLCRWAPPAFSNCHPLYTRWAASGLTFDGWVFEYTGSDTNGDIIQFAGSDATAAVECVVKNSVYLPNAADLAAGSLLNNSGGFTQTNLKARFDHNTVAGGTPTGNQVWGVGAEAGTVWPAGTVPSVRSNVLWRAASGTGLIGNSHSSATVNTDAVTAADYNWTYNVTGSIYGVPTAQWAGSEGANDGTGDPQFVDATRSLLNFDTGYLGAAVGTAWADATPYAVGDVRSVAVSGFFGNRTYNYRCSAAHTSAAATNKPGSGSAWTGVWEPAALKSISDDVLAGTTYQAGANSLVGELVRWVKAGFAPRNAALKNAGHDGVTIGAVEAPAGGGGALVNGGLVNAGLINGGLVA